MVITENKNMVKCTIVGDGMVGKTCLIKTFLGQDFPEKYIATVEDSYIGKTRVAGDTYDLIITDTSIQHDYEERQTASYKNTDVFIICYSTVDRESFESVRTFWLREIRKETKRPVILIATQSDLRKEKSKHVSEAEGRTLAKTISAYSFIECSSKLRHGLNEVFVNCVLAHLSYMKSKLAIIKNFLGR